MLMYVAIHCTYVKHESILICSTYSS